MSRRRKSKPGRRASARPGGGLRRAAALLAAVALVSALLTGGGLLFRNLATGGPSGPRTAAIVDQLSLTVPNPTFVEAATATLKQAGYEVDYFPGEEVTVEFYRNLPTQRYGLIILRVHSALLIELDITTGSETPTDYVGLFTSEPYSDTRYSTEPVGRLGPLSYYQGGAQYFGIGPNFIRWSMTGKFDKTLVIMMGCDGLRSERTGQAFLDRGASAFVSWSESVSAAHTDAATEHLLELLLVDGLTIREAVSQTAAEVGPDPAYGAELRVVTAGGG